MRLDFSSLTGVLIFLTAATIPATAIAQSTTSIESDSNESIAEAFNRAYYRNDPEFFYNRSFKRQLDFMFGPGSLLRNSYPENEINRDAQLVDQLYQDVLEQQADLDPLVRTPDLPNPYNTSILSSPTTNINNRGKGIELIFERKLPK